MPSPLEPLITPSASQPCSSLKAEEPDLREKIRVLDRQRKLDDAATRRLELRRAKERVKQQLEAVRAEKSRLDSLASIKQDRELWCLQEEARVEQRRLRDEAGIRAGGPYKRPAATQQAIEPCAKKTLVQLEDRHPR